MAYITPNSDVILCKGVPIDSDYNHTVLFANATNQYNAFYYYKKYTLDKYSYQRSGKNKIRVGILADNLYDCNYMMFRNTAYSNKWFYAFIETREYINDNTSEIIYKIDVMQTWYFDYVLEPCYVEREHSLTDEIGANRQPEMGIDANYVDYGKVNWCFPWTNANKNKWKIIVLYYTKQQLQSPFPQMYAWTTKDGVFGCYQILDLDLNGDNPSVDLQNLRALLDMISAQGEGEVYAIYQIPLDLWTQYNLSASQASGSLWEFSISRPTGFKDPYTGNEFIPKNKKMLQAPYNYFTVTNNSGVFKDYFYEDFLPTSPGYLNPTFAVKGFLYPKPELILLPELYKNGLGNNLDYGIKFDNFPECNWSVDGWTNTMRTFSIDSLTKILVGALTRGAVTTETVGSKEPTILDQQTKTREINENTGRLRQTSETTLHGIAKEGDTKLTKYLGDSRYYTAVLESMGQFMQGLSAPPTCQGALGSYSTVIAIGRLGYTAIQRQIPYDIARSIDDYFSMFGYATNKIKVPNVRRGNVTLRPHWNYVKTANCVIHPSANINQGIDAESESDIAEIYNHGITFWNSISEVGNYNLDNTPIT